MKLLRQTSNILYFEIDLEYNLGVYEIYRYEEDNIINWHGYSNIWHFENGEWHTFRGSEYIKCKIPVYEKLYLRDINLKFLLK